MTIDGRRSRVASIDLLPVKLCGVELSNQFLLSVAAFSFLAFVIAEVIGALAGNSLSLLGDAAAMSVDVFTYFCNMYSEHVKSKQGTLDINTRLMIEVFIPSFSVIALLAVTVYITVDAVDVVLNPPEDDNVNVYFMYGFAGGNALVDVICFWLFFLRRKDVLNQPGRGVFGDNDNTEWLLSPNDIDRKIDMMLPPKSTNLNMASALTHVSGDTMRTMSVFVAAVIATTTNVDGTVCDAWAAIFVTVTIVFLVIPLIREIIQAARVLYTLKEEGVHAAENISNVLNAQA